MIIIIIIIIFIITIIIITIIFNIRRTKTRETMTKQKTNTKAIAVLRINLPTIARITKIIKKNQSAVCITSGFFPSFHQLNVIRNVNIYRESSESNMQAYEVNIMETFLGFFKNCQSVF